MFEVPPPEAGGFRSVVEIFNVTKDLIVLPVSPLSSTMFGLSTQILIFDDESDNNWNRQKTAKWLQMSYRSLLYKLNEVDAGHLPSPSHSHINDEMPSRSDSGSDLGPGRRL